jgi:hypothetical protein
MKYTKRDIQQQILDTISTYKGSVSPSTIFNRVYKKINDSENILVKMVNIKIETLNLVTEGKLILDKDWKIKLKR